ncbi:hypothetical protein EV207_105116 [Scopulibacillus darangshiensis]|uniref:histidine kinase n=1 Tax=Scopulibacillus darangshiensis TaxID=442528 RepID=A0A4R2P737_9BACL|nr:sensor histidine kinase [Scopulibacillus darangshiensis]TCP30587.1 hypothetical protein EV207_105116 [Scopulibacillus darangshiensis]
MRLSQFLKDRQYLILFYVIMMVFISLVVYLDPHFSTGLGNIIYFNTVTIVFFFIYLLLGFFRRRKYVAELQDLTNNDLPVEVPAALPEPLTHEQALIHQVLIRIYQEQLTQIQGLHNEKVENQEFIISWVHDIKTPISASKMMIKHHSGRSPEEALDKLEDELAKIDQYVEQALYYSRVDTFSKDYFISEFMLDAIVKASIKKHAKMFISKKINVDLENVDKTVLSDKKWLAFIIDQIIINAIKYTDQSGKIQFIAEENGSEIRLAIKDNGIGIKTEDIGRVFEKGFTGALGRKFAHSTGMGLYLSKKLARKLGHELTIISEEGEGTTVTIHFPKALDFYQVAK